MTHQISLGDFITIAFGSKASCPARVEGFTKTGKLIIRRFNKSRDEWYANTAKIGQELVLGAYAGPAISGKTVTNVTRYNYELRNFVEISPRGPLPELN
jgi:hypothetical protein